MNKQSVDTVIVGGGFVGYQTLKHTIDRLATEIASGNAGENILPQRITIINDTDSPATGIPYSHHTPEMLALGRNTRDQLRPEVAGEIKKLSDRDENGEPYPNPFQIWLAENVDRWMELVPEKFKEENKEALDKGEYDGLFFPRIVFGEMLKDQREEVLERIEYLKSSGVVDIEFEEVRGRVGNIKEVDDSGAERKEITFKSDDIDPVMADQVMLAVGLPYVPDVPELKHDKRFIPTMYRYGGFERIKDTLMEIVDLRGEATVTVIGTSQSYMDFIHYVNETAELKDKVTIVGVSRNGVRPVNKELDDSERVKQATSRQRYELFYTSKQAVAAALEMEESGQAQIMHAEFTGVRKSDVDNSFKILIEDKATGATLQIPSDMVINGMGRAKLSESPNTLMRNLIGSGMVEVNSSGYGIETMPNGIEAGNGFLVIGPLQAKTAQDDPNYTYRFEIAVTVQPYMVEASKIMVDRMLKTKGKWTGAEQDRGDEARDTGTPG